MLVGERDRNDHFWWELPYSNFCWKFFKFKIGLCLAVSENYDKSNYNYDTMSLFEHPVLLLRSRLIRAKYRTLV